MYLKGLHKGLCSVKIIIQYCYFLTKATTYHFRNSHYITTRVTIISFCTYKISREILHSSAGFKRIISKYNQQYAQKDVFKKFVRVPQEFTPQPVFFILNIHI